MENDDEPELTLSKWPFYLGDALLVATALAIAILGDWNLTNWQVLSCVLAVVMGAALLCLPFLFEHWLRNRERQDDRTAQTRVLERKVDELTEAALNLREDAEVQRARCDQLENANEAIAEMVDQKLAALDTRQPQTEGSDGASKARTDELAEGIRELQDRVGQLANALSEAESKLAAVESAAKEARVKPDRKERSPRQPTKPEARLLHRAIKDESASKSEAVSRIIRSTPKAPTPSAASEPDPTPQAEPGEPTKAAAKAESPPPPETPKVEKTTPFEAESPTPPEKTESSKTTAPKHEPETAETPEPSTESKQAEPAKPDETVNPVPTATPEETAPATGEIDLEAEVPAIDTSDMLFDEMPESPARKKRTKKTDTVLRANILIGIGNKPFVRGEGGGLSWEAGVPMEFESIGSWRWLAPPDAEGPIRFQIFRNDEDPDATGRHQLEIGQQLEIEPKF